jgi:hypothetical protein
LRWFFRGIGSAAVIVYPILDAVEAEELSENNGEGGNRARVIELCKRLDAALPKDRRNVRGLIDKDYSELLGTTPSGPFLLVTDFSCLECYSLDDDTLHKFSNVYLGMEIPLVCYQTIFEILKELFLFRAAKISLGNSSWVEGFTKLCSLQAGQVCFNSFEFAKRLVYASRGRMNEPEFRNRVEELRRISYGDFRHFINAHDLISILAWYGHRIGVHAHLCNEQPLQRALLTSVEIRKLMPVGLFRALTEWVGATA